MLPDYFSMHRPARALLNRTIFSVKYQVLSKETAMVGVVKQKKKATGELEEHII